MVFQINIKLKGGILDVDLIFINGGLGCQEMLQMVYQIFKEKCVLMFVICLINIFDNQINMVYIFMQVYSLFRRIRIEDFSKYVNE